jgi:DNA-binding SARP family transcriptional activator
MAQSEALKLRFLGEIQVERGNRKLSLPQSKKTRALLAYIALAERPERRERLCGLFWDVADDPRGALRWSLSRLRPLVDSARKQRLITDRDHVALDSADVWIDLHQARHQAAKLSAQTPVADIEATLNLFRGDFLEGLELPDFDEFQAWCMAEREQARLIRARMLTLIMDRLKDKPAAALPYGRTLVHIDPLHDQAHATLVRLLLALGRIREARLQYDSGMRLLKEANIAQTALQQAWQSSKTSEPAVAELPATELPQQPIATETVSMVGRTRHLAQLSGVLETAARTRRLAMVLVGGEPGIGKTRLLNELVAVARQRAATILEGSAFEAEASRPYGPWIDALRKVPQTTVGSTIGADLATLVPELAPQISQSQTRDQLFGAVVELIASRAHSAGIVLLVLDDMQWCDDASAELLHYVVRSNRHRPVMVVLAARSGELADNTSITRLLRSIRRDTTLEQIALDPLSEQESRELAAMIVPQSADLPGLADTAGNPLFIVELARAGTFVQPSGVPQTLMELVRDRVSRLPLPAQEIVLWGAAFGTTFAADIVSELAGLTPEAMMRALETLERYALIRTTGVEAGKGSMYAFSHNLVRNVVYSDISEPRRRIIHARIAGMLAKLQEQNESITPDVVQHAALAGDAALAASACVAAGKRCLRLFANLQAESFAKRGTRFAEQLLEPERVKLLIELTRVTVGARKPEALDAEAERLEHLAERALDYGCMAHARLAFHLSSYLRWEGGDWSDAERDTLRAELISRTGDARERLVALAEAARCLTMLERDVGRASALLVEASQISERIGVEAVAVPITEGLIHEHEGRSAHALRFFRQALDLARRDRDRENEFSALQHMVMLQIDQDQFAAAQTSATELVEIGEKLREGSDAPFAKVLKLLAEYGENDQVESAFDAAVRDLQTYDAKHRLAYALSRAAAIDLRRSAFSHGERRATAALEYANILERPSEIALARTILGGVALAGRDRELARTHARALEELDVRNMSDRARSAVQKFIAALAALGKEAPSDGNSGRRKIVRTTG